jgi:tetratricopeptide (TPR) repeat protein
MQSPVEPPRTISPARAHLDRGVRFEQAGTVARALIAYRDSLEASESPEDQVEAHLRIARVLRSMAEYEEALAEARAALKLADLIGADDLAAEAINVEVGVHQLHGDFDLADALSIRALERAHSPRVRGITLQNQGRTAAERRDFETANRLFTESIEAFNEAGYELGKAIALANAAAAAREMGQPERALELGAQAATLGRRLNALDVLLTAVQNQAAALVTLGNVADAEGLLTEALGHFTSARNVIRQAECLEIMGELSELRPDDADTARRCYSRALDLAVAADDRVLIDRLNRRLAAL